MDQYLFLFPIEEYFKSYLRDNRIFNLPGHPSELVKIIDARYRNKGYGINWLLFSQKKDLSKPDLSQVPECINIQKQDGILVAGVSFDDHVSKKVYADSDYVLDQLLVHKRLVVGGFHQFDCVDRLARRSYERGVDTFVDEDTTNLFFMSRRIQEIPLIRERWSLKELGMNEGLFLKIAKENRKDKPWFVQS